MQITRSASIGTIRHASAASKIRSRSQTAGSRTSSARCPAAGERSDEVVHELLGPAVHERHLGATDADVHRRSRHSRPDAAVRSGVTRASWPVERNGRLGFVPPRYGPGVVGGAEAVLDEMALGLAERGWDGRDPHHLRP